MGHQLIARLVKTDVCAEEKTVFHILQSNNVLRSSHISALVWCLNVKKLQISTKKKSKLCYCYICCTEVCFFFKTGSRCLFNDCVRMFGALSSQEDVNFSRQPRRKTSCLSLCVCVWESKRNIWTRIPAPWGACFVWRNGSCKQNRFSSTTKKINT